MKKLVFIFTLFISIWGYGQQSDLVVTNGKYHSQGVLFSGVYELFDEGVKTAEVTVERGVLSGEITYFYASGKVREIGNFLNGKRNGTWIQYDERGQISGIANYKNDQKHGKWLIYDSGSLRVEMHYQNDQKVGTWKMWDKEGVLNTKVFN